MGGSRQISNFRNSLSQMVTQFRRSLRYVWDSGPQWLILRVFLIAAQTGLPLAAIFLLKLLLDTVASGVGNPSDLIGRVDLLVGAAALVALLVVAAKWLSDYVMAVQGQAISDYMQGILHRKSIAVDIAYFENPEDHDTLHRALNQGPMRPGIIFNSLAQLTQCLVTLVAIAVIVLAYNPLIGVIVTVCALPAAYVQHRHGKAFHAWSRENTAKTRMSGYLHSLLVGVSGAKEIRSFRTGELLRWRFASLRLKLLRAQQSLYARRSLAGGASQGLTTVAMFSCYAYFAHSALRGQISVGDLVLFYEMFRRAQEAMRGALNGLAKLYEDNLYLTHMFEFLDLEPTIQSPSRPVRMPERISEGIRFEAVSFRYPHRNSWALRDIHLTLRPDQHIALVGENGSGKSTLVKLILRLYDPCDGVITLDGTDIRDFDVESYRASIGVLFQDHLRYHFSARENIRLAGEEGDRERDLVHQAASDAGIEELIDALPAGYETTLGLSFRGGVELSAGEWQKIGLARALAVDPQIVILDEPTSAFDPNAESLMIERFRKIIAGRAALTISHRLSTIRSADTIHVLAKGSIVESGSHDELVSRDGRYKRMFSAQSRHYT